MIKKLLVIAGTRPEVVKLVSLLWHLKDRPDVDVKLCSTGQHQDMLRQMFDLFEIRPDYELSLTSPHRGLAETTAAAMVAVDRVLGDLKPDAVIVQGDTTSTVAGAMAAFYRRIAVAHVEAGLRSGNPDHPFPEEVNRCVADRLSEWLFAPTSGAKDNLLREGFPEHRVIVTGNTTNDLMRRVPDLRQRPGWKARICRFSEENPIGDGAKLLLVTAHRRESFGAPLEAVLGAVRKLSARSDVEVVYPAHPNFNVQRTIEQVLAGSRVRVVPAVDYAVFTWLLERAHVVLTDSGGVQEEAAFLGKPTLVLRETTERPEAVHAGVASIVGFDPVRLEEECSRLLDDPNAYSARARPSEVFGDGNAAGRIADALLS